MKKALKIVGKILLWLLAIIIIFFVSMYFITWGNYSVPKTVENDKSLPHITVNNIVYHAETFGDKKNDVVVVIHGGPGNDYRYLLPLKALANDYFVIFYDQRGSGLSPRVEGSEQSLENSLKDLSDIIDHYSA